MSNKIELFGENFRWDTLEAQFYQWLKPIPDSYCKSLSKKEKTVHESICNEYPEIIKNELAFIMGWVKGKYNYMNIGIEKQKNIANDILEAKKLFSDKKISGITINGKSTYKFKDEILIKNVLEQIKKRIKFLEKQLHTEYIVKDGKETPKNFYIKRMTTDFYKNIIDRYKLGNSQAMYVIGEIYACYGIGLTFPILTKEQFEANIVARKVTTQTQIYKQYLQDIIKAYLIP